MEKIQDAIDPSSKSPVITLFIAVALGLIYWPLIARVWVT